MSALLALLLALPVPGADPCADVFDRTARCEAVDVEALPVPIDAPPALASSVDTRSDLGLALGWRFLAGASVAAVASGAAGFGSVLLDAHARSLEEAGQMSRAEDAGFARLVAQSTAGGLLLVSGLLAGTSAAFLVFDPSEGRVREAFRIEE